MKLTIYTLMMLLPIFTNAQVENIDYDGYGSLKLGMLKENTVDLLEETDSVPSYAWFTPASFESAALQVGYDIDDLTPEDSAEIYDLMVEMEAFDEAEFFIPTDTEIKYFCGLEVAALALSFDENAMLIKMQLVIDKKDVSDTSKAQLLNILADHFQQEDCAFSLMGQDRPNPFYCGWPDPDRIFDFVFSDEKSPGGSWGESVNIVFSYY